MNIHLPVLNGHPVVGVIATRRAFVIIVHRNEPNLDVKHHDYVVAEWFDGDAWWAGGDYDFPTYESAFEAAVERAARLNGLIPA